MDIVNEMNALKKFFNAIFNIADMAISTGVGILIVFNKKAFAKKTSLGTYE